MLTVKKYVLTVTMAELCLLRVSDFFTSNATFLIMLQNSISLFTFSVPDFLQHSNP